MRIVKSITASDTVIANLINDNNLAREDILYMVQNNDYRITMFYYWDSETKEKTRNFWGDVKE